MKRAKAIAKTSGRSFDVAAFRCDLESAIDAIARDVGARIKETLIDKVTDQEVKDLSEKAARIALLGLFNNHKVMRHVADARTSQDKRKLKKGKSIPLVESQIRAVELRNSLLGKQIPDQLVAEKLATILSNGRIKLNGMGRAIPDSSWDSSLTRWTQKVKDGA